MGFAIVGFASGALAQDRFDADCQTTGSAPTFGYSKISCSCDGSLRECTRGYDPGGVVIKPVGNRPPGKYACCEENGVGQCALGQTTCAPRACTTSCTLPDKPTCPTACVIHAATYNAQTGIGSPAYATCEARPSPAGEMCNGIDDDCDGRTDVDANNRPLTQPGPYTGPPGTETKGECRVGAQTCGPSGWGETVGEVTPVPDECGDGKDNDCSGKADEGCGPPPSPGPGPGPGPNPGPTPTPGPDPEGGGGGGVCNIPDEAGAPVNMTSGNMHLRPILLARLPTPTGTLELTAVYNSKKTARGILGIGWTTSSSQLAAR